MKRLLFFLLLIAISGCSNNLSYKTKEGKKIFIREDTVQIEKKLLRKDFRSKYITNFYNDKDSKNRQLNELKRRVDHYKLQIEKEPPRVGSATYYLYERDLSRFNFNKIKLSKAEKNYSKWLEENDSLRLSLLKFLPKTPEVHAINISFTAVETDLLNKKRILPRFENIVCFNPKLDKKYRTIWESKLGEDYVPPDNICKKFAKF